jgi:poly-gamma-glutamate synthesis protein (capsule biosynthesis protein)
MYRREFLLRTGKMLAALTTPAVLIRRRAAASSRDSSLITLALCGDVMTGRGIDQVLAHPSDSILYECFVRNAIRYVELAEGKNGLIPRPVEPSYIWGDALAELDRLDPDVRIVNLETAVTTSDDHWEGKGINYRMHPENISCITVAGIDCCTLANNHTLDWGYSGLAETIDTLDRADVRHAGAGRSRDQADQPAILELPGKGRVIVLSVGSVTSGIPSAWAATGERPGVSLLSGLTEDTVEEVATRVERVQQAGDLVVLSIHWGSNWGYEIPEQQRWFAHRVIDEAGVDIVHGHSSHHPRGIEVYRDKPILYGCGDFLNDYEGIGGHEQFRSDLALLYFVSMDSATGALSRLEMAPFQIRRFRAHRAAAKDASWLRNTLSRVGRPLGTQVVSSGDDALELRWQPDGTE